VTTAFGAEFLERQKAEGRALFFAASDPLTGLGNYRRFFDTLEAEIIRSGRSDRSFAFLLMDLVGLKKINETHGHLAGDRALCRLANILQKYCREIDLTARHGSDEFALIIPEAGAEAAHRIARRISERLAGDGEHPPLAVSIGAAVFPRDGDSIVTLLQAADRALVDVKRQYIRQS
jgi:diguanylate cyclase (GGDEF)-like protein